MATCNRYGNLKWLSYARGQLDFKDAAEMESHIESCRECREQLDFSRKIGAIMDLNSEEPPESWTEEAAAKFELIDRDPEPSNIFGELVFDSYLHDREAVRSRSSETRHLVFDLPRFEVDLALEYCGRELNTMMGHVLPKPVDSAATVEYFSLDLLIADRVYSAKPNQFGEFSLTVGVPVSNEPMELRCVFKEGPCVTVLIPC